MAEIKQRKEVVRYEENSKTIDHRVDKIRKRELTQKDLMTEQNQ